MSSWRIVRIVAGLFILLSLALGIPGSPLPADEATPIDLF